MAGRDHVEGLVQPSLLRATFDVAHLDARGTVELARGAVSIDRLLEHPTGRALEAILKAFPAPYQDEHTHLTGALDADIMRGYVEVRREILSDEGFDPVALLDAVVETPAASGLLRRFAEIALGETPRGEGESDS